MTSKTSHFSRTFPAWPWRRVRAVCPHAEMGRGQDRDTLKGNTMEIRHALGKRIIEVRQRRVYRTDISGFAGMQVEAIVLEDGTEIRPFAFETGYDYGADAVVVKPRKADRITDGSINRSETCPQPQGDDR